MRRLPSPRGDTRADSPRGRTPTAASSKAPRALNAQEERSASRRSAVTTSCPTLGGPADCSPPGPSAHGTAQARTLSGLPCPPPGDLPDPPRLNWHLLRCRRILYHWATGEVQSLATSNQTFPLASSQEVLHSSSFQHVHPFGALLNLR